jgi:hypothetical protein
MNTCMICESIYVGSGWLCELCCEIELRKHLARVKSQAKVPDVKDPIQLPIQDLIQPSTQERSQLKESNKCKS